MNKDSLNGALRHALKMRDLYRDYWKIDEEHNSPIAKTDKAVYEIYCTAVKAIELELSRSNDDE